MLTSLDVAAVQRFTGSMNERLRQCDNGEGMVCGNLDETINCHVKLCQELRTYVNEWARAVFSVQTAFDGEVEKLLKDEVNNLLNRAKEVAAYGRVMNGECYELEGLNALHFHVAALDYLLENWVSPQPAVSPAPRVKLPEAAAHQILERLGKLTPLPVGWQPDSAEQLAFFQKQLAG